MNQATMDCMAVAANTGALAKRTPHLRAASEVQALK